MAKVTINKMTADGEQISVEVAAIPSSVINLYERDPHVLSTYMAPFFRLADDRIWEMNKRVAAANIRMRSLDPAAQIALHEIHAILHGQQTPQDIQAIIEADKQRQEAELAKPGVQADVDRIVETLQETLNITDAPEAE